MKKKLLNFKNNKKLTNWILSSGLSLIIGSSLILNIIFIPKYFQAANHNGTITTEITIDAVQGSPNGTHTIFFNLIEYATNFRNLGDLIKHFTQRYDTRSYPGAGDFITGISKNGNGNFTYPQGKTSWFIYQWDSLTNQWIEPDNGSTGMDLLTLHNHDRYRIALDSYNS